MEHPRHIVLCADDFALSEGTSTAILRLVEARRLSAVSCLTDAPLWPAVGAELRAVSSQIRLGLHFNLTEAFGFDEQPLASWILRSLAGRIDATRIRAHFDRQLAEFTRIVGREPDFVDGHCHVHAFPQIRQIVAERVTDLRRTAPTQLRSLNRFFGRTDAPFKRLVIRALAHVGRPVSGVEPSLHMNTAFAGDYSLGADARYETLFADWIAAAPDGALIMCHPSLDPGSAFENEYRFLRSPQCAELFTAHGAQILGATDPKLMSPEVGGTANSLDGRMPPSHAQSL
jgi:predicted glycoside hydrolase/deacetylase ChbG (UPF0249 family)